MVARLVSLIGNESVTQVRESALNSVSEAFNRHRVLLAVVEPLTVAVETMEPEILAHALYIFGATQDPQARLLIEPRPERPWRSRPRPH